MNAEPLLQPTERKQFMFHDVSDFPVVRLSGRGLPDGHGTQWAAEMDSLLAKKQPFVLIFLDTLEKEEHDDKKVRAVWIKRNKKDLAALCRGFISIEPDKATRLLKRAQGVAMAAAFGLRLKFTADVAEAEALARRLLAGENAPDTDGE